MGTNFCKSRLVGIFSLEKFIPMLLLYACFILLIASCVSLPSKVNDQATIASSDMLEVCVQLSPDQVLDYFFESSLPLSFEILYHENGKSIYAYSMEKVLSDSGVFYPDRQQFYCMKWINSSAEAAKIVYDYHLLSSK